MEDRIHPESFLLWFCGPGRRRCASAPTWPIRERSLVSSRLRAVDADLECRMGSSCSEPPDKRQLGASCRSIFFLLTSRVTHRNHTLELHTTSHYNFSRMLIQRKRGVKILSWLGVKKEYTYVKGFLCSLIITMFERNYAEGTIKLVYYYVLLIK